MSDLVSTNRRDIERHIAEQFMRPLYLMPYTVADLPDAYRYRNCLIFVSDESGGSVPAFSDGTDWRRATDRAVVS